ncbi:MAG TPA: hypothetical protein VGC77_14780 [Rhodopseudomonas sp.]|uniref:hypothetical protein n=1 Tax=Rhodopseudomonas sp. TaxID=1078 RepID=UPI002ED9AE02
MDLFDGFVWLVCLKVSATTPAIRMAGVAGATDTDLDLCEDAMSRAAAKPSGEMTTWR